MTGAHDLGGRRGLGPIAPEAEASEPLFHAEWERRAFAVTLAAAWLGRWNLDMSRHARERQHPATYLTNSYYENWLAGLETLLLETAVITAEELALRNSAGRPGEALLARVARAGEVAAVLARGRPVTVETAQPPRFKPGDVVRARNHQPAGHTRLPRYARGRDGTVHLHHGAHLFADASAAGVETGQHLYSVRFEALALWGSGAKGRDAVYIDLWQDHLEAR